MSVMHVDSLHDAVNENVPVELQTMALGAVHKMMLVEENSVDVFDMDDQLVN